MNSTQTIPKTGDSAVINVAVSANGKPLPDAFKVHSVTIDRHANRIPTAQLLLADGDPALGTWTSTDAAELAPGSEVKINLGYGTDNTLVFSGIVVRQAIQSMPATGGMLRITCKDKAVRMTVGRKSTYHEQETDGELIEALIKSYGLTADVEATKAKFPKEGVVQYYSTDWDFMVCRAEANGQLVLVDNGTVTVQQPLAYSKAELPLEYGGNIYEFEAEVEARDQYKKIEAEAWDPVNQTTLKKEAETPALTVPGDLSADDLAKVMGVETLSVKHSGQLADTELQAWANGLAIKSALSRVVGRARFKGYPSIKPGQYVELSKVSDRFDGNAYVTAVQQTVSGGNWETEIQFGMSGDWFASTPGIVDEPAAGLLPAVTGLQIAVVTELADDPTGEDRIRVRMPLINKEEEGIWARVASITAGKYHGGFFRPDVGDEVVVGFLNDDPRDPVVLGHFNSSEHPAPLNATNDNYEKGIYTKSGLRLAFDDESRSITLMTAASGANLETVRKEGPKAADNQTITLSDGDGSILIQDKNGNKIEFTSDGITIEAANKLTLKAPTIDVLAETALTATSKSNAEFSANSTTTVKGGMVYIN